MHGLLFNIKSDKDKYDGNEFKVNYKVTFKDPNKQWDDNIANSFFINDMKKGSPQEVKGGCGSLDPVQFDKFYDNLTKLHESKEMEKIASKMSSTKTHVFEDEGIILFCVGETIV
ncbi:MAG: hypothetical protein KO202_02525 [Methanobacteriaceae archaeon]|jgi:hypothetical protein|nr:hypothetical protein [Methanobacteriaceae archaeon]